MPTPWLWGYGDRLSVRPGEAVTLHLAGSAARCEVEIARVGRERRVVRRLDGVALAAHPVPERAHVVGCGWPPSVRVDVPADWPSGYYDVVMRGADGAEARHCFVVRAARPAAPAAIVLATNTYHAYNWWGGANTYVWIGGPEPAPWPSDGADCTVATRLSAERPFSAGIMRPRSAAHRIVAPARRGFREPPVMGEVLDEVMAGGEGWDCPAGFLDKWEHAFVAWAEEAGYPLDYLTDARSGRRDRGPLRLPMCRGRRPQRVLELAPARRARTLRRRGRRPRHLLRQHLLLAVPLGRRRPHVRRVQEPRRDEDPCAADPARRHLTSGLWSSPWVGRPEAALTGLSFLFGGYHRFGLCVSRGLAGYTVWRDDHWALAGADLHWGDVFGDDCRLVGYENDGCPFTIGDDGLPHPVPRLGVPEGLEIIATVPAALGEPDVDDYSRMVPPEAWDVLARAYAGYDAPDVRRRLLRGHAVMATFTRGAGQVFNGGTTEWAYGLAARNPFVERITRNVLDRFLGLMRIP